MSEVDKSQLMRYIDIEKEIQQLESQNVLKNYEVRKKAAVDVAETIKSVEITLQQLSVQTKKEKADVDNMLRGSIKQMFKEKDYEKKMSKEQEEYLEARNKEEVARQQLEDLKKQHSDLQSKADEIKGPAGQLEKLYEERDSLLSDIFGGEYGSEKENLLEAQFDQLMDRKQRVGVAHYKWTNARILLQHAVNQLSHSVQKWTELGKIPPQECTIRYNVATETRNNNIAAIQNTRSCTRYLGDKIEFPYCKEEEMCTMERATQNIYIDMQDLQRYRHAHQCYDITMRRAAALLQWFDNVIQNTIQTDLKKVTEEARKVEKELRAERIKLIRDKVAESGGDVKGLTDAEMMPGLKGLTDGFSKADQTKLSDEDMDMKGIGITRPAPVGDDHNIPDAQQHEMHPPAPTPLPLAELAPQPCEQDLFGDISELKEQYKKDTEEFKKAQDLNKARMEQGLQAKLAARRHKKK
ncbi:uncharacterized protein LOC123542084 isoform X5 [Mercenaria mercenaria]|uniref:uncharacterized protein LOC123542084 isoform X5 n=1 Tax=Mercenaria mercenaria TaxID=6596 RepID=UPI00234E38D5|nr:uncharacterized protein LOC123542084 isoform X5 [Mercenaria mercenaria]